MWTSQSFVFIISLYNLWNELNFYDVTGENKKTFKMVLMVLSRSNDDECWNRNLLKAVSYMQHKKSDKLFYAVSKHICADKLLRLAVWLDYYPAIKFAAVRKDSYKSHIFYPVIGGGLDNLLAKIKVDLVMADSFCSILPSLSQEDCTLDLVTLENVFKKLKNEISKRWKMELWVLIKLAKLSLRFQKSIF